MDQLPPPPVGVVAPRPSYHTSPTLTHRPHLPASACPAPASAGSAAACPPCCGEGLLAACLAGLPPLSRCVASAALARLSARC
uniref:Uncharacterized protein n=1 Tax=Siphoviridae sp. ctDyb2 TaxID=2826201 RepID=A0A8S5MDE9_9CAUD|nr:MAG TPA: hypothetical protein [Siphoviridae sp. ctDyb2]